MSIKVVSCEANIGCGKTTLINEIMKKERPSYIHLILVPEPVDLWMNIKVGDKDILSAFYANKKEVALPFQLIALITRKQRFDIEMEKAKQIVKETGKNVILITERTIHSDRHIFANMLHKSGDINEAGIVAYNLWNDNFVKDLHIDKTVYINTNPQTCHKRIIKRSRPGEDVIPLTYLEECQRTHDDFYSNVISKMDNMIIDTSDVEKDTKEYEKLVDDVYTYIIS